MTITKGALTKAEREILLHRLAVPDAILDALTDCDDPKHTEEQIAEAIDRLTGDVEEDGCLQMAVRGLGAPRAK